MLAGAVLIFIGSSSDGLFSNYDTVTVQVVLMCYYTQYISV